MRGRREHLQRLPVRLYVLKNAAFEKEFNKCTSRVNLADGYHGNKTTVAKERGLKRGRERDLEKLRGTGNERDTHTNNIQQRNRGKLSCYVLFNLSFSCGRLIQMS